jgi:hypothetical protein
MSGETWQKEQNMNPEPNFFLVVRGVRQILLSRDADELVFAAPQGGADGVTLRGELAPARVSIAAVATCLASEVVRS